MRHPVLRRVEPAEGVGVGPLGLMEAEVAGPHVVEVELESGSPAGIDLGAVVEGRSDLEGAEGLERKTQSRAEEAGLPVCHVEVVEVQQLVEHVSYAFSRGSENDQTIKHMHPTCSVCLLLDSFNSPGLLNDIIDELGGLLVLEVSFTNARLGEQLQQIRVNVIGVPSNMRHMPGREESRNKQTATHEYL